MTETTVLSTAEETLGTVLLRALLAEVQQLNEPWHKTAEHLQAQLIERLRLQIEEAMRGAVRTIATAGFGHVVGELESATIKDGVKASLVLPRTQDSLVELLERVGTRVVVVFADVKEFIDGMHVVRAESDQPDLPLDPLTGETISPDGESETANGETLTDVAATISASGETAPEAADQAA